MPGKDTCFSKLSLKTLTKSTSYSFCPQPRSQWSLPSAATFHLFLCSAAKWAAGSERRGMRWSERGQKEMFTLQLVDFYFILFFNHRQDIIAFAIMLEHPACWGTADITVRVNSSKCGFMFLVSINIMVLFWCQTRLLTVMSPWFLCCLLVFS